MLHASQIRAARGLLGWHQQDLARKAEIGLATIQRLEKSPEGPVMAHVATAMKIMDCLKKAGVVFLDVDATGGVGVRLDSAVVR